MSVNPFARVPAESSPRILVVDDDRRVLELLELAFSTHGFRVLTAADGEEALKQALSQRPDLVVLDVRLPRKSGLEVCEALRRDPEESAVPIILVSAAVETETRLQAFARGADDYLTKPFSPKELIARVKRLLARSAESREAQRRARELEHELARAQDEARRAHLETRREQRMRELAFGLGRELHRTLDLDELAERILAAAQIRLGVGMAALLTPDPATGQFVPRAVRGDGLERVAGIALEPGGEMLTLLEGLARPVLRRDLERFAELKPEIPALIASGLYLLAPLRGPERLEALLATDERLDGAEPPGAELELLAGLCEIGAVALANARRVRDQADGWIELVAARAAQSGVDEAHRAEAASLAERAARATLLPPRQRELLALGLRLGGWSRAPDGARALEALEIMDPTGRLAELRQMLSRARRLLEPLAEALAGEEAPDEAEPGMRRATLMLAAALGYAAERGVGLDPGVALARALARVDGHDPSTAQALESALREGLVADARLA